MAAVNCGTEALMLGNLMMLVSGSRVRRPSSASVLGTFWSSGKTSENSARIRAATEMSLVSISMPAAAEKVRTTGRKEHVANEGASSVSV